MKSYLDFKLDGSKKVKSIKIIGTFEEKPFEKNIDGGISEIKTNVGKNVFIDEADYNYGDEPHKEDEPVTIIFTDENGYETTVNTTFKKNK